MKLKIIITILIIVLLLVGVMLFYYFLVIRPSQHKLELSLEQKKELSLGKTKEAQKLMEKGDASGCEKLAQEAIDLDPENVSAYILLGQSKYVQGKVKEARDVYLKGLEKDSTNFQLNFGLANSYRDLREYDLSAQYYEKTIEINPDDPIVWNSYGFLFFLQEKWEKAMEIYEKALEKFPDNPALKSMYESAKEKAGIK